MHCILYAFFHNVSSEFQWICLSRIFDYQRLGFFRLIESLLWSVFSPIYWIYMKYCTSCWLNRAPLSFRWLCFGKIDEFSFVTLLLWLYYRRFQITTVVAFFYEWDCTFKEARYSLYHLSRLMYNNLSVYCWLMWNSKKVQIKLLLIINGIK